MFEAVKAESASPFQRNDHKKCEKTNSNEIKLNKALSLHDFTISVNMRPETGESEKWNIPCRFLGFFSFRSAETTFRLAMQVRFNRRVPIGKITVAFGDEHPTARILFRCEAKVPRRQKTVNPEGYESKCLWQPPSREQGRPSKTTPRADERFEFKTFLRALNDCCPTFEDVCIADTTHRVSFWKYPIVGTINRKALPNTKIKK